MPLKKEDHEPSTADAYAFAIGLLEDLGSGRVRSMHESEVAAKGLEVVKKRHQAYLNAVMRVTMQVNIDAGVNGLEATAERYRKAIGEAYLGGPLL